MMTELSVKKGVQELGDDLLSPRTRLARMKRKSLNLPLAKIVDNHRTQSIIRKNRKIEEYLNRK